MAPPQQKDIPNIRGGRNFPLWGKLRFKLQLIQCFPIVRVCQVTTLCSNLSRLITVTMIVIIYKARFILLLSDFQCNYVLLLGLVCIVYGTKITLESHWYSTGTFSKITLNWFTLMCTGIIKNNVISTIGPFCAAQVTSEITLCEPGLKHELMVRQNDRFGKPCTKP